MKHCLLLIYVWFSFKQKSFPQFSLKLSTLFLLKSKYFNSQTPNSDVENSPRQFKTYATTTAGIGFHMWTVSHIDDVITTLFFFCCFWAVVRLHFSALPPLSVQECDATKQPKPHTIKTLTTEFLDHSILFYFILLFFATLHNFLNNHTRLHCGGCGYFCAFLFCVMYVSVCMP